MRDISPNNSLIVADDIMGQDLAYKYSHNAPSVRGRNLIKSIKQVAKNNQDASLIPDLLNEVRIN